MSFPKVSIITPSYQQGSFLERTIQSVLTQDIPNLEYLVMDGGSQDKTISILQQYETHLTWLTEHDKGQAHAVNKGFKKASGEIIGWLNSDDVYYPEAIEAVCNYFAAHPEVDVVYGQANHIDEQDNIIELYPTEEWSLERLKQTCFLSQPAVFFRRQVLEQHGLLDEELHYCMDYEFWLRLGLAGVKFGYIRKVLAGSRLHEQTKTLSAPVKAHAEAIQMLKSKINYIPSIWLINYAVALIKSKTRFRLPQIRFLVGVWIVSSYAGLRYNGAAGMIDFVRLPIYMISRRASNKKL